MDEEELRKLIDMIEKALESGDLETWLSTLYVGWRDALRYVLGIEQDLMYLAPINLT